MQDDGVLDTPDRVLPSTPLKPLPDNAESTLTLQVQTCRGRGAKSGHKVRLGMGNGNLDSDSRKSFNLLDIAEMRTNDFAFESRFRIIIPYSY
ncbi:hypothetical protein TNCV_414091 [Trichonephila clavipes]|nr:hypothetical protein TNCV_414091 [Trichonephila clavipes]